MLAARRYALLDWARRTGAFIVEDDYNGEFRHADRQALSLDGEGAAILTLEIPENEAPRLVSRFHELKDRTFFVSIVLKAEGS